MNLGIAVDIGIGLALMYLLLSLLVTAINELIAQFGSIRARHLESALKRLLDLKSNDTDAENLKLFDAVWKSPTLRIAGSISKTAFVPSKPRPSYIGQQAFVAALREAIPKLDNLLALPDGKGGTIDIKSVVKLGTLIRALPDDSRIKGALTAAIADAQAVGTTAEQRVGEWFDNMMERATGAYKRWMAVISLLVGMAFAVALNCDTVHVANALAKNPELRAAVQKVAQDVLAHCGDNDGKLAAASKECGDARTHLDALQALPIGWRQPLASLSFVEWLWALLGWLITGCAVSLGAPFWFDLLSKVMTVRSSLKTKQG